MLDTCKKLERSGYDVTYLPVETDGLVSLEKLKAAITDKTILVTIMYANNEIGVVQPVQEIGKLCHEKGILFHTDAVQAVGKIPVNVQADEYRCALDDGAQDLRAEGCGRAVRSPAQPACADYRADQRRRA